MSVAFQIAVLLFWVSASFKVALLAFLLPFARPGLDRLRVRCLVRAFTAGTGWGGDDGVLLLLLKIEGREKLLEDIIRIDRARGRQPVMADLLLDMLRALPPDLLDQARWDGNE